MNIVVLTLHMMKVEKMCANKYFESKRTADENSFKQEVEEEENETQAYFMMINSCDLCL